MRGAEEGILSFWNGIWIGLDRVDVGDGDVAEKDAEERKTRGRSGL